MSWHSLCYCHTCRRDFQALGIARHRAMHRDKREDCKITFSTGHTYTYGYSKLSKPQVKNETP